MNNAVELVKRAAMEAFNAAMPSTFMFGTVIETSPLKIQVDQKTILTSPFLVLSSLVSDFTVDMTVDETTSSALDSVNLDHTHGLSGTTNPGGSDNHKHNLDVTTATAGATDLTHTHTVTGKKTFIVHLGLKKGEKVILIRQQGGQKFIVLDRAR